MNIIRYCYDLVVRLFSRVPITRVWTVDYDGETRMSWLRGLAGEEDSLQVKKIVGWAKAKQDGTVINSYMKRWIPVSGSHEDTLKNLK